NNSVTPTVETEADTGFLWLSYSQTQVFTPGSRHTVKVSYTNNSGKAITESIDFVATRYVDLPPTPVNLVARITERDWMKLDPSKGVKFTLDGKDVSPVTLSDEAATSAGDNQIFASASLPTPLAAKSAHTLVVTYTTDQGQVITETVPFTVMDYPTLTGLGT